MRGWLVLLLMGSTLAPAQVTEPSPIKMPPEVAIFAVQEDEGKYSIDPIVVVTYGADRRFKTIPAFSDPIRDSYSKPGIFESFWRSFYKQGSSVTLFAGGERLGAGEVLGPEMEPIEGGCTVFSAAVEYSGRKSPLPASSLATVINGHPSRRRVATKAETQILRRLASQWLREYGLDETLLLSGRFSDVVTAELRRSRGRAIIGRFDVESSHAIHRLLVIAEPDANGYGLTLTHLDVQRDMEDGIDRIELEYIDQLDIDTDSRDELITTNSYYERWDYTIWRFDERTRRWRLSYTGGGGGC